MPFVRRMMAQQAAPWYGALLMLLLLHPIAADQGGAGKAWGYGSKREAQDAATDLATLNKGQKQAMFQDWKQAFKKSFRDQGSEDTARGNWERQLDTVIATNSDPGSTWVAALNEHSGLSWQEFSKGYLGAQVNTDLPVGVEDPARRRRRALAASQSAPAVVDWVAAGKVSAVKNQNGCAACWAFASTAALESVQLIQNGVSLDLSEEQLLDCVGAANGYGSQGCSGGYPTDAFDWVYRRNQTLESLYPYTGVVSACNTALLASTTASQIIKTASSPGYGTPKPQVAHALQASIASHSPTVVYWAATAAMQTYSSGVFPASSCTSADPLNHVMLAVGYDTTGLTPFVRLKNSWGAGWGEGGYLRAQMLGDGPGTCGMYLYSYYPLAAATASKLAASPPPPSNLNSKKG